MENTPKSAPKSPHLNPKSRICPECGKEYLLKFLPSNSKYCAEVCDNGFTASSMRSNALIAHLKELSTKNKPENQP